MIFFSTLLKQAPGKKKGVGDRLIGPLMGELLFPASRVVREGGTLDRNSARHATASEQRAKYGT